MEQTQPKRGRGRPKGSSRYSQADSAILGRVAEALFRDPALKPTTAIKHQGIVAEAALRRLQRHWKSQGHSLLSEVKRKDELRRVKLAAAPYGDSSAVATEARRMAFQEIAVRYGATAGIAVEKFAAMRAAIEAVIRPNPQMAAMREMIEAATRPNPRMDAMRAAIEAAIRPSPHMDAIRATMESANRVFQTPRYLETMRTLTIAQEGFDQMSRALGVQKRLADIERTIGAATRAQQLVEPFVRANPLAGWTSKVG